MFLAFMLTSGIFWTATYILIIRQSILDRTYGMPLVALCANISWEFIFAFLIPPGIVQHIVNIVWFSLDLGILVCFLYYGRKEFVGLSQTAFYTMFTLTLATSFAAVLLITLEFHDSGTYSAFGQNLMMSTMFLAMLYRRGSLRGQSLAIAICKGLGTLAASLAFYLYAVSWRHSLLLFFLYITIFVYDALYVALVYKQKRLHIQKEV
jgi:hypothetical protein